jgi:hypothetical protein
MSTVSINLTIAGDTVAQITYADATVQTTPSFNIGSGAVAAGVYGDIDDIRAEMGEFNEQASADPDNAGDAARIALHEQKAIAFADAVINNDLARYGFATPATASLGLLRVIFGKLGAYQLYQVRGLSDKKNAFQAKYDWAIRQLRTLIRMSQVNGAADGAFTLASGQTSAAPQSIAPTTDVNGTRQVTTANPTGAVNWWGWWGPYGW